MPLGAWAAEPVWSGDTSFSLSFNSSDVFSRRTSSDAELLRQQGDSETSFDLSFDREVVKVAGERPELNRDKYDVNVKFREFLADGASFLYLSPRLRHNANGYYVTAQALRVGVGRRWQASESTTLTLETGTGARHARIYSGGHEDEMLWTLAGRMSWKINPQVQLRLNVVHEQSNRERYRTLDAVLRTSLTEHLGLQVKASYSRGFPFSSTERTGEAELDLGVSYAF